MIDPTSIPQYKPEEIEPKWQTRWEADGLYHADPDPKRTKFYALTMLPYPSGDLHIGHWYAMLPPMPARASSACKAITCSSPSALMPLGCPPKTPPSSIRSTPSSGLMPISSACACAAALNGQHVRLAQRGHHLRPRVLPLDAMVFWSSSSSTTWLIKWKRRWISAPIATPPWRVNRCKRRRSPLRALRHARYQEEPEAVALPHHQLRRRAARFFGYRLPETIKTLQTNPDRALQRRLYHLQNRER